MYYILDPTVRLKKWKGSLPCYSYEGEIGRIFLSEADYALLKSCDGTTELPPCDSLFAFEAMKLIRRCGEGEFSLKNGQIREYPNYYFRSIDWTVTERCNFNCLHCFHAADNSRNWAEFSRDEAFALLREAEECGIPGIRLTGGEPTLYPYFREVLAQIKARGLVLKTLITNGAFLNEELLLFIKELHPNAQIMLSFDGIGTHDWMRQQIGSEQQVKRAIRLSKAAGFYVKINMNVNRRNSAVMFDSARMLINLGVNEIRIIRTTEAPRWQLNAADNSLTPEEYYDFSAEFAAQYKREGLLTPVIIWQSLALHGERKLFAVLPVKNCAEHYRDDALLCSGWINKVSVQANGEVVPCAPFAGYNTLHGISFGNMKRDGLKKVLSEGPFVDFFSQTVGAKKRHNAQCAACPYFTCCQGGCPALSILSGGDALAPDAYKCVFFQRRYYDTFRSVLSDWSIKHPLPRSCRKDKSWSA